MIHWSWLIVAFVCGVGITLLCIKKALMYTFLHYPAWASALLKSTYERVEEFRLKKLRNSGY